jgi:hypothetical protein
LAGLPDAATVMAALMQFGLLFSSTRLKERTVIVILLNDALSFP